MFHHYIMHRDSPFQVTNHTDAFDILIPAAPAALFGKLLYFATIGLTSLSCPVLALRMAIKFLRNFPRLLWSGSHINKGVII